MAASRLGRQISELVSSLGEIDARFALIGGLALASHKVVRATQDVDLLVEAEKSDEIHAALAGLGYQCLHRSGDAANYARGDERVDFLYATRPIAKRLLQSAAVARTSLGEFRVVSAEGLIGFKLQGFVNDPSRTRDVEDIRAVLRANRDNLDLDEVRSYFRLFEREASSMSSSNKHAEAPFAAEGGLDSLRPPAPDPFRTLDELMAVVEELCPTWPSREVFRNERRMLM